MLALSHFSAVIFDMDGLVLDTETTYAIAWQQAAEEMGFAFTEQFCLSMSGLQSEDVLERLQQHCGQEFDLNGFFKLSGAYWKTYVEQYGIVVKKGFHSMVKQLNEYSIPYCLATNSRLKNAQECLEFANIEDVFPFIISRDQVENGKPAPDIFLKASDQLDVPIARCLVLEDSGTGIAAAVSAGARSVFIPSVFPIDQSTVDLADYYINDLEQLSQIFHQDG